MQREVVCFWLEPTDRVRLWLRRYVSSHLTNLKCPLPFGYHNATFPFGDHPVRYGEMGNVPGRRFLASQDDMGPAKDDPRWPTKCACGYEFKADDPWQVFQHQIYRRVEGGSEMTIEDAPPGAMWNAWWYGDTKAADGINLMVKLPNGSEWWVDGPAKGGGHWTRTGTIPKVSAQPSIWADQGSPKEYHGFLTAGVLRSV